VATTSADDTARLWDAASGELVASLRGHTDELGGPRFTADGRRLMTVSDDGSVRIWHVPQRPQPIGGGKPLEGAALSPDGTRVFTWIAATSGRLYDARTRRVVAAFGTSRYLVTGGSFLRGGRLLLTAVPGRGAAELHDARDGRLVRRIAGPPSRVAAASSDGRRVITLALGDKAVTVFDVASGRRLATLAARDTIGVALSPDAGTALTMSLEQVSAWDAASGKRIATLQHRAGFFPAASFSPDSTRAVITSLEGSVPVWNMRSDRATRFLRLRAQIPGQVLSVAWSPGGDLVSIADRSDSGAVRTFDPASGRAVAELRGHRGEVRSASFSPDSRWIVTAGVDATARIWDARSGRQVAELLGHRGELVGAAFARDGRHVLTASKDGTALLHDCEVCATLAQLRASIGEHVSAGRELTAAERREYLHE
jgi:DNA-binding beta-propeller fold protein YncE